jgi:thiosulfate reductase cytochrome b subunit
MQNSRHLGDVAVKVLEHKHKLVTRWAHWVNFPILAVMIWSGLLIYWSNDVYRIGLGRITLFHFFPDGFYSTFKLNQQLAFGMAVHFCFMWLFAINGLLYFVYTIVSGEWRELAPHPRSFREAIQVTMYDLRLAKTLPPQGKYNAAQKIAYSAIILMGFGSILTGLSIYRPVQLSWLTSILGGYKMARFEHFWLTMGYVGFFLIHVTQVVKAGWSNFQSIVTGVDYREVAGE